MLTTNHILKDITDLERSPALFVHFPFGREKEPELPAALHCNDHGSGGTMNSSVTEAQ